MPYIAHHAFQSNPSISSVLSANFPRKKALNSKESTVPRLLTNDTRTYHTGHDQCQTDHLDPILADILCCARAVSYSSQLANVRTRNYTEVNSLQLAIARCQIPPCPARQPQHTQPSHTSRSRSTTSCIFCRRNIYLAQEPCRVVPTRQTRAHNLCRERKL